MNSSNCYRRKKIFIVLFCLIFVLIFQNSFAFKRGFIEFYVIKVLLSFWNCVSSY